MDLTNNPQLENELFEHIPESFRDAFLNKLKAKDNYWETINEMRTIVVFDYVLKIPVINIDHETVKDKNVDIFCRKTKYDLYVEVKSFKPKEYQKAKQGGILSLSEDEAKIDRALTRARTKFRDKECNIVVLADENTIQPPLYESFLIDLDNTPETYLNCSENSKISGLIILGGLYFEELFKFKFWPNINPSQALPEFITNTLNRKATKHFSLHQS